MNQMATITSKKQLTLPSEIFTALGLRIGERVIVSNENGRIVLTPAERLVEELAGSVSVPKKFQGKDLDKVIEIAKIRYFKHHKK